MRKESNFGAELALPLREVCDHVCCCWSVWCSSGGVGRRSVMWLKLHTGMRGECRRCRGDPYDSSARRFGVADGKR